ncbi:MAG: YihY/virulence factor BrkB family protein [Myxococcales bacterium]|nr:YihY/virulence factor BrkB family protein [Myxococcales bacterium]
MSWRLTWLDVAAWLPVRVIRHTRRDDATVLAAGVAMYLLLGLLPTLAAVVSIYALIADPSQIEAHLAGLDRVVPAEVYRLLVDQLQRAGQRSPDELRLTVLGGVLLALWSSRASANALLVGIEHVDGTRSRWRGWRRLALTFVLALGALVSAVTLLALVVAMPATSATLAPSVRGWLVALRWPTLVLTGVSGLSVLYALGGPRRGWRHIVPGALVATALGLLASLGVSYYVTDLASYQALYGTFGSAMVVVLWFYACSLAVLIGAVVNTELRVPSDPGASRV